MKTPTLLIGGLILILLLAAAAFVGARLLNGQGLVVMSSGGPIIAIGKDQGSRQGVKFDLERSQELPQQDPDVQGVLDHHQDNSIFVGTGQVQLEVHKDQSGTVSTSSSHDGPIVEVVVTAQTTIYCDVTMQQFNGERLPNGKIPQVLGEGSVDEIGQDSLIMAWGRKTGDRLIAAVLVYTPPEFMTK